MMKSKMIFIAYQDDFSLRSLSTYFQSLGYEVESARTVSEAIQKIRNGRKRKPDILLLDEEIEGVKAFDLVPIFKRINPTIQVIVVSSQESVESAKRLRAAGIFYQAMKPIDLEEVRSAAECALEKIKREHVKEEGFSPFLMPQWVPA